MIKKVLIGLTILAVVGAVAVAMLWRDYQSFLVTPLNVPDGGVVVTVNRGERYGDVVEMLTARSLTTSSWRWRLLGRLADDASKLRAGEFLVPTQSTPPQIIAQFASGDVILHGFTIVEGWNLRELRAALRADPILIQTLGEVDDDELVARLAIDSPSAEGQFLPETYRFARGTTDIEFLRRAHRALVSTLNSTWQRRQEDLPLKSPYEALTLASIIEKETGVPEERRRIAGVFVRRLQKGMRLQTDPTVIYGLGPSFDGDIRRRDLRTDTPYNTYTRHGLPPTPIAMAGEAALAAAVDPEPGDALYFVAKGDGSHQFSATLADHNAAVRRYQLGQR